MNENGQTALDLQIAERLERERPVPSAGFRARLRHELLSENGEPVPQRLRTWIAACAGAGGVLLLTLAIGIAGAGPLAAG